MLAGAGILVAACSLLVWVCLALFRCGFWRADQRLAGVPAAGRALPEVVAVVPARNEAEFVGAAVRSLLEQDYSPALHVVLVDDGSEDGTAASALAAAAGCGARSRLDVLTCPKRPAGWTGKLWAVHTGICHALSLDPAPRYLLLTDADIRHDPAALRGLVALAQTQGRDLVSLMVRLHCGRFWGRCLVPAFVFFFQKLFPFPAVNDPDRDTAAAAGGCMLVRAEALDRAGGVAAIRGELIDDCALARRIKANGPIWLGLTDAAQSLRPYDRIGEIWRMVRRSAYTQLGHSPILLAGTVWGMLLAYLAPPAALLGGAFSGNWGMAAMALAAWALMGLLYMPTLRVYRLAPIWGATLPLAAMLYVLMTLDSAGRHWRGRGGEWKGRSAGGLVAPHAGGDSSAADGIEAMPGAGRRS